MSILNTTTSTTRPDDASVGAIYFETDTNRMILWDGTAWREYNADSSSFPPGEYIIVKDNYNTSSAPNSGADTGFIVPFLAKMCNTVIHIMQEELIYMEHFTE